ncbi:MAG: phosphoribosylglycinamide formyltransferase [Alsobacter sp.]
MARMRTAVLVSGRGSNMAALLDAAADPAFPAEIVVVLSNRPGAGALTRAEAAGVPTTVVDHRAYADRAAFEAAMQAELERNGVELVCLAGFLRVLTPWFIGHWPDRLVNIHPSLLPAYRGLHTHERALADGVRIHGCTVHLVVPELDAGPIIAQAAVPVHGSDTPDTLAARVLAAEHRLYPLALSWLAAGRVRHEAGGLVVDAPETSGMLLSPGSLPDPG